MRCHFRGMWTLEQVPKRITRLLDGEGKEQARLVYPSAWSSKAEILFAGSIYTVRHKRWFSTDLIASVAEAPVWELRFGWFSTEIHFHRPGAGQANYVVERPSVMRSLHRLLDAEGREVARFNARSNWKQMGWRFELEQVADPPPDPVVLLLAIHAVLVRIRRAAAAAS